MVLYHESQSTGLLAGECALGLPFIILKDSIQSNSRTSKESRLQSFRRSYNDVVNYNHLASKQERIEYVDIFRAIGIILMIMGHIGFGSVFDKWIHIFHMPMFFVISGYFYKSQRFTSLLKKRLKTLILPYLVFGVFHCCLYSIFTKQFDVYNIYLLFWENTAGGGIPIAGALWFLTAMFFAEIFFWILQMISVNQVWKSIIACIVSFLGVACAAFLPFRLPWALDVSLVGVAFYQFGYLFNHTKFNRIINLKIIVSILGLLFFSAIGLINGSVNLRKGLYGIWPLFYISAFGVTISLWNISRIIYEKFNKFRFFEKVFSWLKGIGKESIVYLCLNQLMILVASKIIGLIVVPNSVLMTLLFNLLILIFTLLLLFVVQKVIMGTKLKVIMGKF